MRRLISANPELTLVLAAAVAGLSVQRPLAFLAERAGINLLLAVLVFATGLTIEPAALRRLAASWRLLLVALATGMVLLPALAWACAQLVPGGPLRGGVMAVGLAPCEVASVATTAMAAGDVALSAGVLIGSTVLTVAAAGPVLAIESGRAVANPGHVIVTLAVFVAAPLAAGIALGARNTRRVHSNRGAAFTATVALAALVALTASQARLSARYLSVALALLIFLAASAAAGRLLGARSGRRARTALLLTTSMRDFAIAAGLAAAAFGPAAAAPLGLYGVLVLVCGTAVAGRLRRRG